MRAQNAKTRYNILMDYNKLALELHQKYKGKITTALRDIGEIQKLSTGIGPDRFDGNPAPHYHFICKECGSVLDLSVEGLDHINILANQGFNGEIEGHITYFYGTCADCKGKHEAS